MKIFLDPGHGGHDSGAIGHGFQEKELVLKIGLSMRKMLKKEPDVEAKLSRANDTFIPLIERAEMAKRWGADVFVSIHMNAFNGVAHGVETYTHPNSADSDRLARSVNEAIINELTPLGAVQNREVKTANFSVLRNTHQTMSSILTETLFIDSPSDAVIIGRDQFVEAAARGHVNGILAVENAKRMLRRGSRGKDVCELQQALRLIGINPGPIDGIYGPKTESAVRRFQMQHPSLQVDGVYGPQTTKKLHNLIEKQ